MSLNTILEKLEAEVKKPDFKDNVINDYGSDGETSSVWYEAGYSPDDFDDREFPEPEGKEWEEALEKYIENKWYDFSHHFSKIAKMQDGKLKIYRKITLESVPKFLYYLNKGKPIKGYKGIGVFWSWDKDQAEAHWGHGKYSKKLILIEGLVGINDINYEATARKNLNPSLGEEEAEIEVKENAAITIVKVHSKDHNQDVWQGNVKLAAKFKETVFSRYKIVNK